MLEDVLDGVEVKLVELLDEVEVEAAASTFTVPVMVLWMLQW